MISPNTEYHFRNWISSFNQTRYFSITYNVYNANANLFGIVELSIEYWPTGGGTSRLCNHISETFPRSCSSSPWNFLRNLAVHHHGEQDVVRDSAPVELWLLTVPGQNVLAEHLVDLHVDHHWNQRVLQHNLSLQSSPFCSVVVVC